MSEAPQAGATPAAVPAPQTQPAVPAATQAPQDPELGEGGKRAIAAERTRAAAAEKERDELKARLDKIDQASLSDQEKATKRATEAEDRAARAEARALRYEAAVDAGIPLTLAARLQGATREDLVADAQALKEQLGLTGTGTNGDGAGGTPPPPQGTAHRLPRPDPTQGAKPSQQAGGTFESGAARARAKYQQNPGGVPA